MQGCKKGFFGGGGIPHPPLAYFPSLLNEKDHVSLDTVNVV